MKISQADIVDRITFQDINKIPKIILAIAPTRCGTKASLRVFAESDIASFNQPIKSILRHLLKGRDEKKISWVIPSEEIIYIKETIGPFNMEEVNLNPIEIFFYLFCKILKGRVKEKDLNKTALRLLQEKLHIVFMGRCPLDAWYSIRKLHIHFIEQVKQTPNEDNWYYDIPFSQLLHHHLITYNRVEELASNSKMLCLEVTHFVMEAYREPEIAYLNLFKKIGIDRSPIVKNWTDKSLLGEGHSMVSKSDDKMPKKAGMFHKVNEAKGIRFCEGKGHLLSEEEKRKIEVSDAVHIHKIWSIRTENDLTISLSKKPSLQVLSSIV